MSACRVQPPWRFGFSSSAGRAATTLRHQSPRQLPGISIIREDPMRYNVMDGRLGRMPMMREALVALPAINASRNGNGAEPTDLPITTPQSRTETDTQPLIQTINAFNISQVEAPIKTRRARVCRRCKGSCGVACKDCKATGKLPRGGYQKKNPVNMSRIIGSKWTAMERTFGWRHFHATQKRKEGKSTYVLLVSTCDEKTQFWVNVQNLRERQRFAAGWLQKVELNEIDSSGAECRTCSGSGKVPCPLCSNSPGAVVEL